MSLLTKMRMIGLAGLAGLVMACGAGDGGNGPKPGCLKDADCKGNRICVEGVCVEGEEPKEDLYVPKEDIVSDNYQPNCTSHFQKVCSGLDLYWQDSCGNPENKLENCSYGCSNGMCNEPAEDVVYDQSPNCNDECTDSGQTKCFGSGWKECGDYDSDSCLEWGSLNSCSGNEKCQNGECISTGCSSSEFTCNNGSCIPEGYVCNGGADCSGGEDEEGCPATCNDECDYSGQTGCSGFAPGWMECGNYDSDPCLEWSSLNSCEGYKVCSDGKCVSNCSSSKYTCNDGECISLDWICDGTPDCNGGEDEEGCCEDECSQSICVDGSPHICVDDNGDGCLEVIVGICGPWTYCQDGECKPVDPDASS